MSFCADFWNFLIAGAASLYSQVLRDLPHFSKFSLFMPSYVNQKSAYNQLHWISFFSEFHVLHPNPPYLSSLVYDLKGFFFKSERKKLNFFIIILKNLFSKNRNND